MRVADLEIDALHQRIRQGRREVRLSPVEHILLYTLAAKAGAVVSYREIGEALGRTDPDLRNNTLARHIQWLAPKASGRRRSPPLHRDGHPHWLPLRRGA